MNSRKIAAKVSLSLFGILLILAAIEIGMRIHHSYLKKRSIFQASGNSKMVFQRKPNSGAHINSLGFTDYEHPITKPEDVFRILVLGDSVTVGYPLEFQDIYTNVLQSLLNQESQKYEVINFGTLQYSTEQEVALFEELGIRMKPDLVVLSYVLNDPGRDGAINEFFEKDKEPSFAIGWLLKRIHNVSSQNRSPLRKGCIPFDYYSRLHCDSENWQKVCFSFRKLKEVADKNQFLVLVTVFPLLERTPQATFQRYPWTSYHRLVIDEAKKNGFKTLDLLPYYEKWKLSEIRCSLNDSLHPNKLGHRIAADAIYQRILKIQKENY